MPVNSPDAVILFHHPATEVAALAASLRQQGIAVSQSPGDAAALLVALAGQPAATLVLCGPTAAEVATLRRGFAGLILVLGADAAARIAALDAGADVALPAASGAAEMRAQLQALRRRRNPPPLVRQPWRLDATARELRGPDGAAVGLTSAEYEMLACLDRAGGQPVGRDVLARRALRRTHVPGLRGVDALVVGLRRKIASAGGPGNGVKSVRGVGYACPPVARWPIGPDQG